MANRVTDNLLPVEIAWLAGLLEADGSFTCSPCARIQVGMTDEDTVQRVANLLGSKVTVRSDKNGSSHRLGNKTVYQTSLGRKKDLEAILIAIYDFMSTRRKERINVLLDNIRRRA